MDNFEERVQKWVSLDNQVRLLNDEARKLREERNSVSDIILTYVETKNLANATVKISDGKLRFTPSKQTTPLTLKHVEDCLNKCIQDTNKVELIMNFIKENREVKYVSDIKRTYDN